MNQQLPNTRKKYNKVNTMFLFILKLNPLQPELILNLLTKNKAPFSLGLKRTRGTGVYTSHRALKKVS